MGRLDDIVERNRKAQDPARGLIGMAGAELAQAFDPSVPAHERRTKQLALVIVGIVVAAAIAAWVLWPGGDAPGGKVIARDGRTVELSSLWEQRRVVVVFYPGKNCDVCTYILQEAEAHRSQVDADVIAISSHSASQAQQLHEQLHLGFEIYVDPSFQVIPKWKVPFLAADSTGYGVFVVERGGKISFRKIGTYPPWDQIEALTHGDRGSS